MPTISQLPSATAVSAADEIPISQGGTARAASVGTLLASTQPVIIVDSPSLIGRTSIGAGGPEQVDVGLGVSLSSGTLVADGLDHAGFPVTSSLYIESDLVISNQGSPMLMEASLLRGLFSGGPNVTIDSNGVISTGAVASIAGTVVSGNSIGELQVITGLAAQDLVAVSHAGSDYAIAYSNFLDGITIDQAQAAAPASNSDTIWVAQGSNVMVSQTFSAIWVWVANNIPTYKAQVVEITISTNLDTTVHNGRVLVCSQPVTLTPLTTNMGSGFQCVVINASAGNVILGAGFVSSSGSLVLTPWQCATLCCANYSAGTIAFAAMPAAASVTNTTAVPGQVTDVSASGTTNATITVSWQSPTSGGAVVSYIVQFRVTGTTSWGSSPPVASGTTYELTTLQSATSYDIAVIAQNSAGSGTASTILTVATTSIVTLPAEVSGLTASPTSSSTVTLSWSAQTGTSAATSFTVQYRLTGSSSWTSSIAGVTGTGDTISGLSASTSYDFSVIAVNSAGAGPISATVTAVTTASQGGSSNDTGYLLTMGTRTASGPFTPSQINISIDANDNSATADGSYTTPALVSFGWSTSNTVAPTTGLAAMANTLDGSLFTMDGHNQWWVYATAPASAGAYYMWFIATNSAGNKVAAYVSPTTYTVT